MVVSLTKYFQQIKFSLLYTNYTKDHAVSLYGLKTIFAVTPQIEYSLVGSSVSSLSACGQVAQSGPLVHATV